MSHLEIDFLPAQISWTAKNISVFLSEPFKNLEDPSTMNPRALFGLYESLDAVQRLEEPPQIFQLTTDTIKAYRGESPLPLPNLAIFPSPESMHHDPMPAQALPTSTSVPIRDRQHPCDPPVIMPTSEPTSMTTTLIERMSHAKAAPLPTPTMTPSLSVPDIADADTNHARHCDATASTTTSAMTPATLKGTGPRGRKRSAPKLTSAKSTKRVKTQVKFLYTTFVSHLIICYRATVSSTTMSAEFRRSTRGVNASMETVPASASISGSSPTEAKEVQAASPVRLNRNGKPVKKSKFWSYATEFV